MRQRSNLLNGSIDEAALFTKALPEGRIRTYFLEAVGTATGPQLVTDPPVVSPAGTIYATTIYPFTLLKVESVRATK